LSGSGSRGRAVRERPRTREVWGALYFYFAGVDRVRRFDLRLEDNWLNRGQRLGDLVEFCEAAAHNAVPIPNPRPQLSSGGLLSQLHRAFAGSIPHQVQRTTASGTSYTGGELVLSHRCIVPGSPSSPSTGPLGSRSDSRTGIGHLTGQANVNSWIIIRICGAYSRDEALAVACEGRTMKLSRPQRVLLLLTRLHEKFLLWKEQLLAKHPMAEAVNYVLGQWQELNVFCSTARSQSTTM
jgi:hypothetical protein